MKWNTPKQISLAALFVLIYWVNAQTGHMFHPCSLAKVICANVTSDECFMRRLGEKAVNLYNVLNRKSGGWGDRQGGLQDRSGAWVLSSWRCEAPAPHLHWHPVCISLWYPAISPPPELTAVQRGSRAGRHNIQWLLCPMHCMVLQSVCASARPCFAILYEPVCILRPALQRHGGSVDWLFSFCSFG